MMSNIGYISCTRKPTQPLHYTAIGFKTFSRGETPAFEGAASRRGRGLAGRGRRREGRERGREGMWRGLESGLPRGPHWLSAGLSSGI